MCMLNFVNVNSKGGLKPETVYREDWISLLCRSKSFCILLAVCNTIFSPWSSVCISDICFFVFCCCSANFFCILVPCCWIACWRSVTFSSIWPWSLVNPVSSCFCSCVSVCFLCPRRLSISWNCSSNFLSCSCSCFCNSAICWSFSSIFWWSSLVKLRLRRDMLSRWCWVSSSMCHDRSRRGILFWQPYWANSHPTNCNGHSVKCFSMSQQGTVPISHWLGHGSGYFVQLGKWSVVPMS